MRRTFKRLHREALAGEHVAHLRRADAERHRAERAVRRRVAVAARDGHARLGEPEFGSDHVDDALAARGVVVEGDAEVAAVALERREHRLGHRVLERPREAAGRHDVVDGGERALGEPDRPASPSQVVEGLRRGHLVHEVKADEQLRLPRRERPHLVQVPDFLKKRVSHGVSITPRRRQGGRDKPC